MTALSSNALFLETRKFLENNEKKYKELMALVKRYLEVLFEAEMADRDIVQKMYTRKDRSGDADIKRTASVVAKIIKFREKHPDEWKTKSAIHIHDIVACRIVVFYRHQIDYVIDKIRKTTDHNFLRVVHDEYKNKFGYHAHHLVVSSRRADLTNLLCEIQVKTVLHDAWSSRTHSFTYKPPAKVGKSVQQLMESIGDSVEAIEVQTDYLRQNFNRERMFEEKARYAARVLMLQELSEKDFPEGELGSECQKVYDDIKEAASTLRDCSVNDKMLVSIVERIERIHQQQEGLEAAFKLMLRVASLREENDINYIVLQYLSEWLRETAKTDVEAVFWESSILYVMGDREAAISCIRSSNIGTASETEWKVNFNLLYYLIEAAIQETADPSAMKVECDEIMQRLNLADTKVGDRFYSPIQDTIGSYLIAFGSSEEEIERGVEMCRNAYASGGADKAANAFKRLQTPA
jgi:ppGpp synthetase/RelA/SpoT-type nucleotidyltranferase